MDLIGLKLDLEDAFKRGFDVLTYDSVYPLLKDRIMEEQGLYFEKKTLEYSWAAYPKALNLSKSILKARREMISLVRHIINFFTIIDS